MFDRGAESHIYTPGVEPDATRSTVTGSLEGCFWALGSGHPVHQQGRDNGVFVALDQAGSGWVHASAGSPAAFHTTWAAASGIDGCIDDSTAVPRCTAVMLSDQHAAKGYFVVLTAEADRGNYLFHQPDRGPINLAEVPRPEVEGAPSLVAGGVQVAVRVASPVLGSYLDPACPAGVIVGYKVYAQTTPRGAAAPLDRGRSLAQGWRVAQGGESAGGMALAPGAVSSVQVDCTPRGRCLPRGLAGLRGRL